MPDPFQIPPALAHWNVQNRAEHDVESGEVGGTARRQRTVASLPLMFKHLPRRVIEGRTNSAARDFVDAGDGPERVGREDVVENGGKQRSVGSRRAGGRGVQGSVAAGKLVRAPGGLLAGPEHERNLASARNRGEKSVLGAIQYHDSGFTAAAAPKERCVRVRETKVLGCVGEGWSATPAELKRSTHLSVHSTRKAERAKPWGGSWRERSLKHWRVEGSKLGDSLQDAGSSAAVPKALLDQAGGGSGTGDRARERRAATKSSLPQRPGLHMAPSELSVSACSSRASPDSRLAPTPSARTPPFPGPPLQKLPFPPRQPRPLTWSSR